MKPWRLLLLLLLLGVAAALWFWRAGRGEPAATAQTAEAPRVAYDYEAHDVVLRQMGPDGRLAFQVEASQITQLPDSGRITARGITLYHDPAGTEPGGPNRWTLTADNGELPAEGGVVTLSGQVRAHGVPVGGSAGVSLATDHLVYDPASQDLSTDDEVRVVSGGNTVSGRGLQANIRTGEVALRLDVHGTLVP
jgi:lipopolysaccharide export system protein LptC